MNRLLAIVAVAATLVFGISAIAAQDIALSDSLAKVEAVSDSAGNDVMAISATDEAVCADAATAPEPAAEGSEEPAGIMERLTSFCLENLNYGTVLLFMAIESSFIPFPSEAVVPPAAWKATVTGEMNIFLVVLFATVGALIGALINYCLALWLGRPIIYKFANSCKNTTRLPRKIGNIFCVNAKISHGCSFFKIYLVKFYASVIFLFILVMNYGSVF